MGHLTHLPDILIELVHYFLFWTSISDEFAKSGPRPWAKAPKEAQYMRRGVKDVMTHVLYISCPVYRCTFKHLLKCCSFPFWSFLWLFVSSVFHPFQVPISMSFSMFLLHQPLTCFFHPHSICVPLSTVCFSSRFCFCAFLSSTQFPFVWASVSCL